MNFNNLKSSWKVNLKSSWRSNILHNLSVFDKKGGFWLTCAVQSLYVIWLSCAGYCTSTVVKKQQFLLNYWNEFNYTWQEWYLWGWNWHIMESEGKYININYVFVLAVKRGGKWQKWTYTQYFNQSVQAAKSFIKVRQLFYHWNTRIGRFMITYG